MLFVDVFQKTTKTFLFHLTHSEVKEDCFKADTLNLKINNKLKKRREKGKCEHTVYIYEKKAKAKGEELLRKYKMENSVRNNPITQYRTPSHPICHYRS